MKLVFSFLEGYLWEPFESNKISVYRILGYLINNNPFLFELLWKRIDDISQNQFTKNIFHKSCIYDKGIIY